MNDKLDLEGLVPSSLVLGEYSRVYAPSEMPKIRSKTLGRAAIRGKIRRGMQKYMVQSRVTRAPKHAVSTAAD